MRNESLDVKSLNVVVQHTEFIILTTFCFRLENRITLFYIVMKILAVSHKLAQLKGSYLVIDL